MDLAVVLDVVARTRFEVVQVFRVRDFQSIVLADPAAHARRRRHQVDPDRLDVGKQGRTIDSYLAQPAVLKFEGVDHHLAAGVLAVADQFLGDVLGQQVENAVEAILGDLLPGYRAIVFRQGAEDDGDRHGRHGGEEGSQPELLFAMEDIQQFLAGALLVPGFLVVKTSLGDQTINLGEVVLDFFGVGQIFVGIWTGVVQVVLLGHDRNPLCSLSGNRSARLQVTVGNGSRRRFPSGYGAGGSDRSRASAGDARHRS